MAVICLRDIAHPKAVGKRFSRLYTIPLMQGQTWAAKVLGYRDWDALLAYFKVVKEDPQQVDFSAPDELCMPAAVTYRRNFQSEVLQRLAGVSLESARACVDQVAPSGLFTYIPQRPWIADGGENHRPRQLDPVWTPEDHHEAHALLVTLVPRCAFRHGVSELLGEMYRRFESLAFFEYPPEQWGNPEWYLRYQQGQTELRTRNMPRWLTLAEANRLVDVARRLGPIIEKGRTIVAPKNEGFADLPRLYARLVPRLAHWHAESIAHVGEPDSWVGDSPEEIAAEKVVLEATVPREWWPEDGRWSPLWSVSIGDPTFYDRAKTALEALPAAQRAQPEVARALKLVAQHFRTKARNAKRRERQFAPIEKTWHLHAASDPAGPGRPVSATDTPAVRASITEDEGAVIACSAAMHELVANCRATGGRTDLPMTPECLEADGIFYGMAVWNPWKFLEHDDIEKWRALMKLRSSGFGVCVNSNHDLGRHARLYEYKLDDEPRALFMLRELIYTNCWPRRDSAAALLRYMRYFETRTKNWFRFGPSAGDADEAPARFRCFWRGEVLAIHGRGLRTVQRLRILQQAVRDEDLTFVARWGVASQKGPRRKGNGAVNAASEYGVALLIPGLTPLPVLQRLGEVQQEWGYGGSKTLAEVRDERLQTMAGRTAP